MFVEIESIWGDKLIFGKECAEKELRKKMNRVLELTGSEGFTACFCRMYQFGVYPRLAADKIDFVIDLDTHRVYALKY